MKNASMDVIRQVFAAIHNLINTFDIIPILALSKKGSMETSQFENKQLDFVEDLIQHTNANVFLTGKAGTGKTTFLRHLAEKTFKRMAIVAPTGVAAINAGGVTIHSFFQLPFGPQIPEVAAADPTHENNNSRALAAQFQKLNKTKLKIMRSIDLLVIDEISMVRADVLDAIDAILRRARRNSLPFGNLQLLMIGDIHQLAPVAKPEEWELLAPYYDSVYFFSSKVLEKAPFVCVELEHIYRQQSRSFIELLNDVRNNRLSQDDIDLLNSRYKADFEPDDSEGYITLTTHNRIADSLNQSKLDELKSKEIHFKAKVEGTFPESSFPTKEDLILKVGAQVMFVKNDPTIDKRYYNGKIGKIVDYDTEEKTPIVDIDGITYAIEPVEWENCEYSINKETNEIEEKVIGSFVQTPLKLAWAITIHKSQGLTFDKLIIDANLAFAHGQVYVALSRCTSLEGLVLKSKISPYALKNDGSVDGFIEKMPDLEPTQEKIDSLRHDFELSMMLDLFTFDEIKDATDKLVKTILSNDTLFDHDLINTISLRRKKLREEVVEVSEKFSHQIGKLHDNQSDCEQNSILQERIIKGVAYFAQHLHDIMDFVELNFDTDNQAVKTQIKEYLSSIKESLFVKNACFEACQAHFSVAIYQKTKAEALLEAEKKTKKPQRQSASSNKEDDNSLYSKLLSWRKEKEEELNASAYKILTIKSLKDIAEKQPVSMAELQKIKGFGKQRCRQFGAEILSIVLEYLGNNAKGQYELDEISEKKQRNSTYEITHEMLKEGMKPEDIAEERKLSVNTIYNHLCRFIASGEYEPADFMDKKDVAVIESYFRETEDPRLGPAFNVLEEDYDFNQLRIVLTWLKTMGLFQDSDTYSTED